MALTRHLCTVNRRTYHMAVDGSSMLTQKAGVELLRAAHHHRYLGDAKPVSCYGAQLMAASEVTVP